MTFSVRRLTLAALMTCAFAAQAQAPAAKPAAAPAKPAAAAAKPAAAAAKAAPGPLAGQTVKIALIDPQSGLMGPVGLNQLKSFQFEIVFQISTKNGIAPGCAIALHILRALREDRIGLPQHRRKEPTQFAIPVCCAV